MQKISMKLLNSKAVKAKEKNLEIPPNSAQSCSEVLFSDRQTFVSVSIVSDDTSNDLNLLFIGWYR